MKIKSWLVLVFVVLELQGFTLNYDFIVAKDGSGNFTEIQKAIEACKAFPPSRVTIFVKNGIYKEKVVVPSCNTHLTIIGESIDKTIITYDDYFDKINRGRNSTFYTYTMQVLANDFVLENITVENSAGSVGQAVALHLESERCIIRNCRLTGNQDTFYTAGKYSRIYVKDCYIEGTTDYIFGEATVFFEACVLHCKANSFITAASTLKNKPYGFVFEKCKITADSGVNKVFLGRPWRSYAKVVFLNCEMGSFITPEGWNNWSNTENEKTAFFAEYGSKGVGSSISERVKWSVKLPKKQLKHYSKQKILDSFACNQESFPKWYNFEI